MRHHRRGNFHDQYLYPLDLDAMNKTKRREEGEASMGQLLDSIEWRKACQWLKLEERTANITESWKCQPVF